MAQHVVDRLLRDAEARGLGVRRELLRRVLGLEVGLQPGDARLAVEVRAHRGGEAEIVQLRRPQAERKLAHALERVLHRVDALIDARARRRLAARAGDRLQLDLQRRERLANVVMQVAREAPALFLLHLEQAPRQRAQPLVRELELAVQALQRLLRAQPLGDVVDLHQARGAAAPRDEVTDAGDVDRLAALLQVAERAVLHVARLAAQEAGERVAILGRPDVERRHGEELLERVLVETQRRVVDREEAQRLGVDDPHRQRAALEQHAVAPLVRVDLVDEAL